MDSDSEIARGKWLLIFLAGFMISGCISWGEGVYLLFGRDTAADVVKAYEVVGRGRFGVGGRPRLTIEYAFNEPDGTRRTGTDTVAPDWPVPVGGKVPVRYTAGADGRSRLAGHVNWIGLAIFIASAGGVGVFGYRLWREASEATRDRKSWRGRT